MRNYSFQVDGANAINYSLSKKSWKIFSHDRGKEFEYTYIDEEKGKRRLYSLDKGLNITEIRTEDFRTHPVTKEDQQKVNKDLQFLIKPLLKSEGEPLINLQWLYNLIIRS